MLLDEDPAALISNCTLNFNLHPDKSSLSRITSSLSTLSSARTLRLSSLQSDLAAQTRQLKTLQSQHAVTLQNYHDGSGAGSNGGGMHAHAAQILKLDTEKFRVAKAVSELEIEAQRLGGEVRALKAQVGVLDEQGPEGHGSATPGAAGGDGGVREDDDELVLKLKVYRSLGIELEGGGAGAGFGRAVIRNREKGDVHVVDVEERFGRKFYADYFWGML